MTTPFRGRVPFIGRGPFRSRGPFKGRNPFQGSATPPVTNIIDQSDPALSPWFSDGAVTAATTAGETRIQFAAGNQARMLYNNSANGVAYTFDAQIKASTAGEIGKTVYLQAGGVGTLLTLTGSYQTVAASTTASGVTLLLWFHTYGGTARDITVRSTRLYTS